MLFIIFYKICFLKALIDINCVIKKIIVAKTMKGIIVKLLYTRFGDTVCRAFETRYPL